MEFKRVESMEDYQKNIEIYKSEQFCFRGQTNHYKFEDGLCSFITSFQKEACNPFYMFKWTHYSEEILRTFYRNVWEDGMNKQEQMTYCQAVLQHYGWRSFFIDITSDINVASWFASNKYEEKTTFAMVEDSFEEALIEIQKTVTYEQKKSGYGYIYVFDKRKLIENENYSFIDLLKNNIFNEETRPYKQKGYLFGGNNQSSRHLSEDLNECLIDILEVNNEILNLLCEKEKLSQKYLFPSFEEDYIYNSFVSLPRVLFDKSENSPPFFSQSLDIPIYDNFYVKRNPYFIAFYSTNWVIDAFFDSNFKSIIAEEPNGRDLLSSTFIKTEEFFLYLKEVPRNSEPLVNMLEKYRSIILEVDYPCRVIEDEPTIYKKGVKCSLEEDGSISISEFIIEHPSSVITNFGFNFPIYYIVNENNLMEEVQKDGSCPCDNSQRHLNNLDFVLGFCKAVHEKKIYLTQVTGNKLVAFFKR